MYINTEVTKKKNAKKKSRLYKEEEEEWADGGHPACELLALQSTLPHVYTRMEVPFFFFPLVPGLGSGKEMYKESSKEADGDSVLPCTHT